MSESFETVSDARPTGNLFGSVAGLLRVYALAIAGEVFTK
jgi:hypothetical protein